MLEGKSAELLPDFYREGSPLYNLYQKTSDLGIMTGVCEASAQMVRTIEFSKEKGITSLSEMSGHPRMRV